MCHHRYQLLKEYLKNNIYQYLIQLHLYYQFQEKNLIRIDGKKQS
jgi:hypothetical protein